MVLDVSILKILELFIIKKISKIGIIWYSSSP